MLQGLAAGELFELLDGLLWVGHRVELVLDAMCFYVGVIIALRPSARS